MRKKIWFLFKENFELWEEKVGGDSFGSVKRFEKLKKKNFKELKVLKFQNPRREYCGFR